MATILEYKYGKPETRPSNITNPNGFGALCKHLTSMLGNKKWLQQSAGTLMDFIVKHIEEVNRFLKVKPGEELTLPNELARQNAKSGFYSKLFKDKLDDEESDDNDSEQEEQNNDTEDVKEDNINNNNITDTEDNIEDKEGD